MNPIEFMFGIWKRVADEMIGTKKLTEDNIKAVLQDSFYRFPSSSIRNLVGHVFNKVYEHVFHGENI